MNRAKRLARVSREDPMSVAMQCQVLDVSR